MNDSNAVELRSSQARGVKLTVAALVALILVFVAGFVHRIQQPRVLTEGEMKANGAYMYATPRAIGDFSLRAHTGDPSLPSPCRVSGH